ncbi:hypothetical protein DENIT_70031 [Pseudomonas veronii]|uniref:hypothetical protein n=1 Tax=Pseudomonas veronii TaxID=76761 RepID=UPI001754D333|nr:hypothetical protein [Pseudomonas veronii]CAD0266054.1 hypothetical protein DENIT_70031 [Pseudomonas veronii]
MSQFTNVEIQEEYRNLHGELIATVGAKGVIRSEDRGRLGVDFTDDVSGCFVAVDACGRKFHEIPAHNIKYLYD